MNSKRLPVAIVLLVGTMVLALAGCGGGGSSSSGLPALSSRIRVSLRASLLDSSTAVLQIQNTSSGELQGLRVTFLNNDTNQQRSHFVGAMEFGKDTEIGMLEGWAVEPNETVTISCTGHTSAKYKTYRTSDGKIGISEAWW
jgi:hypothetical protein